MSLFLAIRILKNAFFRTSHKSGFAAFCKDFSRICCNSGANALKKGVLVKSPLIVIIIVNISHFRTFFEKKAVFFFHARKFEKISLGNPCPRSLVSRRFYIFRMGGKIRFSKKFRLKFRPFRPKIFHF